MHRGYVDQGSVLIGFLAPPALKRDLVDRAARRGQKLSAYMRELGERAELLEQVEHDHDQDLAAA